MADITKIFVGALAAAGGFITVAVISPFKGEPFDYAAASLEDKQKYLEAKAKNFSRGFNLTKGGASEISNVYVDAESDLVSISVQLKDENLDFAPLANLDVARNTILRTACMLTDRELLTQTGYKMRLRFFKPSGGSLMTAEISGEACAPYIA